MAELPSPEALSIQNAIRLAGEVDRIGDRSARILEQAANRIVSDLAVVQGPATRQALQAQLAQISVVMQEADTQAYSQFVDDLVAYQSRWTGRSEKEVRANVNSALDQGLVSQARALAGPASGAVLGAPASQAVLLSETALRIASTLPPLELTVLGSPKQPYSLQREFARAFLQPNGRSTQQAFAESAQQLQDTFERSVRSAVVSGQTTADLVRQLKGDGEQITGLMRPPIERLRTIGRTGAQSVANSIQEVQIQENVAVEFVEFVATLDSRTSPICRATGGQIYRKGNHPVPPLHFNCRSTIAPHIPGREEGSRSMTMLIEDDDGKVRSYGAYNKDIQDRLSPAQEALLKQNASGRPPSYGDWLKAQPAAAQDVVLGRKNGALFRANDGKLTRTISPGVKRQLQALPKPLAANRIKPARVRRLTTADLRGQPPIAPPRSAVAPASVAPPPAAPPAPAGSGGGKVVGQAPVTPSTAPAAKPPPAESKANPTKPQPVSLPDAADRQKAQKQANAVAAKAKQELNLGPISPTGELMDEAELEAALLAASKKKVAKQEIPATTLAPGYKINPQAQFEASEDRLGSGVFGSVNRTKDGVVKRGMFTKAEITALEELSDSGVTPRVKGLSWEDKTPDFSAGAMGGGIKTRRGYLLMEESKGIPISKLVVKENAEAFTTADRNAAFDSFMSARKKIHLRGFSHQDMHGGNLLYDFKTKKIAVVDLGLARKDPRSALVEAMGTRKGRMNYGQVESPGDYQSNDTIKDLNKGRALSGNKTWSRFLKNRKKVEKQLAADGALDAMSKASIRSLPRSITKAISKERAMELLEMLYEGIE